MMPFPQKTGQITRLSHSDSDITEWSVEGRVTYAEIKRHLAEYNGGPTTMLALWDLSRADVELITADDVFEISEATHARARLKRGGRTALVATSDLAFGLSRMYQSYREVAQVERPFMTFRTRGDAIDWLKSNPARDELSAAGEGGQRRTTSD